MVPPQFHHKYSVQGTLLNVSVGELKSRYYNHTQSSKRLKLTTFQQRSKGSREAASERPTDQRPYRFLQLI